MRSSLVKLVFALGLLLLASFAVAPKLIGNSVREIAIADTLALLPPEARALVSLDENTFDGGWFRSEAQFTLRYLPDISASPITVELRLRIQHGPLLLTRDGLALGLVYAEIEPVFDSAELRAFLAEIPFPLPDTHIDLLTHFNGDVQLRLDVASIDHSAAGEKLLFDGLQLQFTARPDQSAESELRLDLLEAQEPGTSFSFSLRGLQGTSDTTQMNDLLAAGSVQLMIESLSSGSPFPFALQDFQSESGLQSSGSDNDRLAIYQRLAIANIDSDLPVTAFDWSLDVGEIHPELMRGIYTLFSNAQASATTNPGILTPAIAEALGAAALLLLQNSLTLESALQANVFGGDHNIDLYLDWAGLPALTEIVRLDLYEAIAALTITLDLSLDLEAIMRSPLAEFVDPYVQEGYIQLVNGRIILQGRLENLTIQLNDQTLAVDEFL